MKKGKTMFMIYVENLEGDIVRAMTWTSRKEDGIARARLDAKTNKIAVKRIWAETINTKITA
jgi:hypothetical protein